MTASSYLVDGEAAGRWPFVGLHDYQLWLATTMYRGCVLELAIVKLYRPEAELDDLVIGYKRLRFVGFRRAGDRLHVLFTDAKGAHHEVRAWQIGAIRIVSSDGPE